MAPADVLVHRGYVSSLRTVLRSRGYRRLLGTRLVSQASDGAFQVGLASLLLFSPERQPTTTAMAAALAVTLLPYTLVGPFAGVLLDRWQRRQVLLVANLVRAVLVAGTAALVATGTVGVPLYVVVLACLSINRFFLAGLSASLPHVVPQDQLVMANAVTPTLGTTAVVLGAGVGYGARAVLGAGGDAADAAVLVVAAAGYLGSAAVVAALARSSLGPDGGGARAPLRRQLTSASRGMRAGVRHVRERRPALVALTLIGVHRVGYGLLTLAVALLCRSAAGREGDVEAGLDLFALVLGVTGVGFALGAVLTPLVVARAGTTAWVVACLLAAAAALVGPVLSVGPPALLLATGVLGATAQGIKVSVDSIVQTSVDDAYRGRVFSLYDVVFNAAFVLAGLLAVAVVPPDGYSRTLYAGVASLYLAAAAGYRWAVVRGAPAAPPTTAAGRPRRRPGRAGRAPSAAPAGAGTPDPPAAPAVSPAAT